MSTFMYRMLFCFILIVVNVSLARKVTISGTVTDTILETGNGKAPVLKVIPLEACSVSISAGCTETELDKYFVKTDRSGFYSLSVNLPDECTYKLYLFRFDGKAGVTTTAPAFLGIPVDSMKSSIKQDLHIPHQIPRDSVKTTQYAHYFDLEANNSIHGGDTLTVTHRIFGISDNADTIRFNKCTHRILLLTSLKDTVSTSDFNCNNNVKWLYLAKGWFTEFSFKIPVPVDLQKTNASFAKDRKLTLELKVNDINVSYTTPAFLVIDTDIKVENVTTVRSLKQRMENISKSLMVRSNQLHLIVRQPGIYSVSLFSLDGRSVGHVVKDQYLNSGEHCINISKELKSSLKLQIVKLQGCGISESVLINTQKSM